MEHPWDLQTLSSMSDGLGTLPITLHWTVVFTFSCELVTMGWFGVVVFRFGPAEAWRKLPIGSLVKHHMAELHSLHNCCGLGAAVGGLALVFFNKAHFGTARDFDVGQNLVPDLVIECDGRPRNGGAGCSLVADASERNIGTDGGLPMQLALTVIQRSVITTGTEVVA